MGKGKLKKFADMAQYPNVIEHHFSVRDARPFEMKGHWGRDFSRTTIPLCWNLAAAVANIPWPLPAVPPTKTSLVWI